MRPSSGLGLLLLRHVLRWGAVVPLLVAAVAGSAWLDRLATNPAILPPPALLGGFALGLGFLVLEIPVELTIRRRLRTGAPAELVPRPGDLPIAVADRLDERGPGGVRGALLVFWTQPVHIALDPRYLRVPALARLYLRRENVRFALLARPRLLAIFRGLEGSALETPLLALLDLRATRRGLGREVPETPTLRRPVAPPAAVTREST